MAAPARTQEALKKALAKEMKKLTKGFIPAMYVENPLWLAQDAADAVFATFWKAELQGLTKMAKPMAVSLVKGDQ